MTAMTYSTIDPKSRRIAMAGIFLAMLVACLDNTIVGTCGTIIAMDLGNMDLYSWMMTSYLLCETAMIPIAGKMSDHYGRKKLFIIGLLLFMIGSILSGTSQTMEQMIVFRAIQGLGAGIIIPVATASVADFYPPEDRGKMQGAIGAIFGIGSGLGPLVGGAVCKFASWNWAFYINVPLILICFLLTIKKFPQSDDVSLKKIDYLGICALTLLILDVLLYFQWIGKEMEFISVRSILMIVFAIAMIAAFIFLERRAEDPVMAPSLIHNKTVVKSSAFMFIMGLAMIGTLTYIAMYIITIYDFDTLECGFVLIAMVVGMMLTSMGSGMSVAKTGYRVWIVIGSILTTLSLFLMSILGADSELVFVIICLFIFGFGLGCLNSTVMVAVQNSAKKGEIGMTTSTVNVMRSIGSTVGAALFSLIISTYMDGQVAASEYAQYTQGIRGLDLLMVLKIPGIPSEVVDFVKDIFANGLCTAFFVAGILFIIALIIGCTMSSKYSVREVEDD